MSASQNDNSLESLELGEEIRERWTKILDVVGRIMEVPAAHQVVRAAAPMRANLCALRIFCLSFLRIDPFQGGKIDV